MTVPIHFRLAVGAIVAMGALHTQPALAQGPAGAGQQNRQQAENFAPDVKAIADDAAKRYSATIVVDPGLFVPTKPVPLPNDWTLAQTMDGLAKMARGLTWRRIYMAQPQANQPAVIPPAEKLVDSVRALDKVENSGIVLENPATHQATTYVKNWAVTATFSNDLTTSQFSNTPIYVLYSPVPTGLAAKQRLLDLTRESMSMMMGLNQDDLNDIVNQQMQMFMSLDPTTRAEFMGMQMRAGMAMMQSMPPDQMQALIQQATQIFQQGGGIGGKKP